MPYRSACAFLCAVSVLAGGQQPNEREKALAKIAELEKRLADLPPGAFDFTLHNELRHWYGAVDPKKSMAHVDTVLKHQRFDGYMKQVLGGNDPNKANAVAALTGVATKYPEFPNLAAACWVWAGDLETDKAKARGYLDKALAVKGLDAGYRAAVEDRVLFDPADRKPWPGKIAAPKGMEQSPGPWNDPDDKAVWPNTTSRANSDPWIAENHDTIRVMRPRLLLINFSNEHTREHLDKLTRHLILALAESSRYHAYANPKAPPFLKYQVFKFVDLRDLPPATGDSSKIPVKNPAARTGFNMKYRQFFTEEFAGHYAVPDPRDPKRFLRLDELLDGGYVHEVWFFGSGNEKSRPHVGAFEVVEEKPRYDAKFKKVDQAWVQAGNGGDGEQPWVGRSVRLGFVNASRGIGCFMESLSHGMEGTANSGAIPYFTRYFKEYADFNLKARYGLPFDSLYEVNYGGQQIKYPDQKTVVVTHGGKEYRVENYTPAGGSAHFPPNARGHYDLDNGSPVLSTIEDWRIGSGRGGKDLAKPFTNQAFRGYRDLAPDCMGAWLVYWRQNMPGLDNKQKDDGGKPMKNWWPFLFY
jgi:hypothetical protein